MPLAKGSPVLKDYPLPNVHVGRLTFLQKHAPKKEDKPVESSNSPAAVKKAAAPSPSSSAASSPSSSPVVAPASNRGSLPPTSELDVKLQTLCNWVHTHIDTALKPKLTQLLEQAHAIKGMQDAVDLASLVTTLKPVISPTCECTNI